jgi:hypothetical protein
MTTSGLTQGAVRVVPRANSTVRHVAAAVPLAARAARFNRSTARVTITAPVRAATAQQWERSSASCGGAM